MLVHIEHCKSMASLYKLMGDILGGCIIDLKVWIKNSALSFLLSQVTLHTHIKIISPSVAQSSNNYNFSSKYHTKKKIVRISPYVTIHGKTNHIAPKIVFELRSPLPTTTFELLILQIWSLQPPPFRAQQQQQKIMREMTHVYKMDECIMIRIQTWLKLMSPPAPAVLARTPNFLGSWDLDLGI